MMDDLCELLLKKKTFFVPCIQLLNASMDKEKGFFGQEEVNKAYQVYREVCIERDKMRQKLERMVVSNNVSWYCVPVTISRKACLNEISRECFVVYD